MDKFSRCGKLRVEELRSISSSPVILSQDSEGSPGSTARARRSGTYGMWTLFLFKRPSEAQHCISKNSEPQSGSKVYRKAPLAGPKKRDVVKIRSALVELS